MVVHLFNDLNTTAHHALPVDDVPLREETVPIHEIEIAIDERYQVSRAVQQPEGIELQINKNEVGSAVLVPKLEIHSMVVLELAE